MRLAPQGLIGVGQPKALARLGQDIGSRAVFSIPTGASGVYALVLVTKSYSGPAIRVRRASDNAEKDIYFRSDGYLDVATLTAFLAATTGFLKTWYDQSGNNFHSVQATAGSQPSITLGTFGLLPSIQMSGTKPINATNFPIGTQGTWSILAKPTATQNVWAFGDGSSGITGIAFGWFSANVVHFQVRQNTSATFVSMPYAANELAVWANYWDTGYIGAAKNGIGYGFATHSLNPTATITTFPALNSATQHVGAMFFYPRKLSRDENANIDCGLARVFSVTLANATIAFNGNSMTFGTNTVASNETYPAVVTAALVSAGKNVQTYNYGVVGQTTPQMNTYASTHSDRLFSGAAPFIDVSWEMGNDIAGGSDGPTAYANYLIYVRNRRANGAKIVGLTVIKRNNFTAGQETARQAANALLLANTTDFDAIIDVASIPQLQDPTNATYFADGIHLTAAGYALVAAMVTPVILTMI